MSAVWSPRQREWLAALGHEPLVRAPPPAPVLPDDPLLHALLAAAGCGPGSPRLREVLAALPPTAALRGDPAAKRALWPRLRALRRGGP
jgi:hypothetical protein